MKRFIFLICLIVTILSVSALNVDNCTSLQDAIKNDDSINIISNIDCSGIDFSDWYYHTAGGPNFPNGYTYTKDVDGNGYNISNLLINGSGYRRVALFPRVNSSNQVFKDINILNATVKKYFTVAGTLIG